MKGNLKLGIIVLITLSFISTILPVTSAINITSKINANEVTVCEDREVEIKIDEIDMEDYIDCGEDGYNKLADFTVIITVEGDTWRCDGPHDDNEVKSKELEDGGVHTWNVGQKDIVHIKIKLIDRDWLSDDTCDINGKSREKRSVEFEYNLRKSNDEKLLHFNGEEDGTEGDEIDDDDALLDIYISDSFHLKPKLSVEPQELSWNLKFNRNEDVSIPPKKITIKNIGGPETTLKWSILGGDDWYKVSPKSGKLYTGESIVVEVDPKDSISPGKEYEDAFVVYSESGGQKTVKLTAIVTKSRSSQYRETPLLHFSPGLMNLLQKINIIYSKFLQYNLQSQISI